MTKILTSDRIFPFKFYLPISFSKLQRNPWVKFEKSLWGCKMVKETTGSPRIVKKIQQGASVADTMKRVGSRRWRLKGSDGSINNRKYNQPKQRFGPRFRKSLLAGRLQVIRTQGNFESIWNCQITPYSMFARTSAKFPVKHVRGVNRVNQRCIRALAALRDCLVWGSSCSLRREPKIPCPPALLLFILFRNSFYLW